ncbi:MAG: RNA polymerase sigma factor (sigma-70 family) [Flavobacteriales bacterium]|jgi:RNA polymerase sigma factor (sigma-70 family)
MKKSNTELSDLIEGCKENNRSCQRQIYERLYSPMMGACLRYANDRQEAADILQDGFMKVFEKIKLYNDDGSFEGWVRRIIVNTAIDAIRKRKKEFLTDDTTPYQDTSEDDSEDVSKYSGIGLNDVVDAMHLLSPMYRAVFNAYVMDGLTHQEIADDMGITVGTSKSNLSKARARIKEILMRKIERNE